jgi:hypothetical protein
MFKLKTGYRHVTPIGVWRDGICNLATDITSLRDYNSSRGAASL